MAFNDGQLAKGEVRVPTLSLSLLLPSHIYIYSFFMSITPCSSCTSCMQGQNLLVFEEVEEGEDEVGRREVKFTRWKMWRF